MNSIDISFSSGCAFPAAETNKVLIPYSDFHFIRQLNINSIIVSRTVESHLKQILMLRSRDDLEAKMASVFSSEIKQLSTHLQRILIDDMVTAYENRINVLNCSITKGNLQF